MLLKPLRVSSERQNAISGLAERISMERFSGERVDPEAIANQEKVGFRYERFPEEFDGILMCHERQFFIVCNERRALRGTARSRFTFAHELGHYFIPEHRRDLGSRHCPWHFSLSDFRCDVPIEKEADIFAANLLMPSVAFRKKALELEPGIQRISTLASVFGTSLTATGFRAIALDTFPAPAAMFHWGVDGAPTTKRWMSPSTYAAGIRFGRVPSAIPGNSITAANMSGRASGTAATADAHLWFPGREGRIQEEVSFLGSFGWVTVVYGLPS